MLPERVELGREEAEDLAQEVFVTVFKSIDGFRGDSKLSTWLYRVTVNTAWTHKKRAARHRASPIDDHTEIAAAPYDAGAPEFAGEILELRGRLRRSLDRLPAAQREVVVLKDIYGWSHAEIADSMGITVTAAKVRLHRARARLVKDLEASA